MPCTVPLHRANSLKFILLTPVESRKRPMMSPVSSPARVGVELKRRIKEEASESLTRPDSDVGNAQNFSPSLRCYANSLLFY